MQQSMQTYLRRLKLGELQQAENIAVVPLLTPYESSPQYLVLPEVLEQHLLSVTEVSEGGSVPELKVTNEAGLPVLLLDGEELAGTKQNRVLNTTILIRAKSETIILVSCTERGRWSYQSRDFSDSGAMMTPRQRVRKARSVSDSLERHREYRSEQLDVWDGVEEMACALRAQSPTGAMRDVFEARKANLDDCMQIFRPVEKQAGLLVFINGEVVGFDVLSRPDAFAKLRRKLVGGYPMDAVLKGPRGAHDVMLEVARAFLSEATRCEERKFESIGHGWDHRYRGKGILGSALVYNKKAIHCAFFRADRQTPDIAPT